MKVTRRQLLAGAATGALGAAGIYELVDRLEGGSPPQRAAATGPPPPEQHLLDAVSVVEDNDVEVVVPPLHHQLVTARLLVGEGRGELLDARDRLEQAIAELDREFPATPAGLGVTVAWGLPYFRRYVPAPAERHLPVDRRASGVKGRTVRALLDARRFPSDPDDVLLEENDLAVLLRSDQQAHVKAGAEALFGGELHDVLEPRSIRKGFVGGGQPKRLAVAAGVSGADLIPEDAQLFLGFTSTQRAALGPPRIANHETLGYVDLGPGSYFRGGTHMHVSHMTENLAAWYLNFDYGERVDTAFRPGLRVPPGTQTVAQDPRDVASERSVERDYRRQLTIGHSAAIQTSSRLGANVLGEDGTLYRKGTAVPQRADFNTLDNPFFWTATPEHDRWRDEPVAGVHFVVFNPSSDDFHRNRLAMDGVLPDGTTLKFEPHSRGQGFNSVIRTTHRQNFLVPPRRHRSFPLAELL